MRACLLRVDFHLGACRSLKEKRQRLKGIRDRFGRNVNVAVCESGHHDSHQRAQWSFIAAAADPGIVEKTLADIERSLRFSVDGQLVDVYREWLI
jgi:uncharacterized protein YlxP (DUF503 family)